MNNGDESKTLKNLESAIREHVMFMFEREGTTDVLPLVTGWVVAFEVQSLEDGDVIWDNGYAVAETASHNTTVGLAVWLADEIRADANEDDDE